MTLIEDAKKILERATGFGRPRKTELASLVRPVVPRRLRFADDGEIPNNPALPLLVYRRAVIFAAGLDPAAVIEDVFARHGWKDSWRDGIYPFLHFHTRTHEVLGIARGSARVQFGGTHGKTLTVKAGDVIALPAGTGHRRLAQSDDLLVVGAYPAAGSYDEPQPKDVDHEDAVASIAKVPIPAKDPIYGRGGPLKKLWRTRPKARKRRAKR
jgi:uncharacterized protein YjlB